MRHKAINYGKGSSLVGRLKLNNKLKTSSGFTIVELLVVIVVIGILAVITIVSYTGISQRAIVSSLQSDLTNAANQLKLFQVTGSAFPNSITDCPTPAVGNMCIKVSANNSYTYQVNNNASSQTFCISERNGNTLYNISSDSTSTVGGCLTDGVASNGLVLSLDAGNSASYSGSGSSWLDQSSNSNNVTLSNSPTYSTEGGGSLVFDGANSYANFYSPSLSNVATVEMWAKSTGCGGMFMGWSTYDVWCNGNAIGYNTGASDIYGMDSTTVTSLGLIGSWKHYIFEMHSDVSYVSNKIYVNGVAQTLSQISATESPASRNFNGGQGMISGWRSGGFKMPESVSVFRVYNRVLSQSEITKNFNALRGRYGI